MTKQIPFYGRLEECPSVSVERNVLIAALAEYGGERVAITVGKVSDPDKASTLVGVVINAVGDQRNERLPHIVAGNPWTKDPTQN